MTMVKKNKLTVILLSIAISGALLISANNSYAVNLKETYQQALKQDKTYQAAKFTYDSAKTGIPIARAGFLPSLALSASTKATKRNTNNKIVFKTHKKPHSLLQKA